VELFILALLLSPLVALGTGIVLLGRRRPLPEDELEVVAVGFVVTREH
jgi:hypothetical protein